jgi:hypothetical protein
MSISYALYRHNELKLTGNVVNTYVSTGAKFHHWHFTIFREKKINCSLLYIKSTVCRHRPMAYDPCTMYVDILTLSQDRFMMSTMAYSLVYFEA